MLLALPVFYYLISLEASKLGITQSIKKASYMFSLCMNIVIDCTSLVIGEVDHGHSLSIFYYHLNLEILELGVTHERTKMSTNTILYLMEVGRVCTKCV